MLHDKKDRTGRTLMKRVVLVVLLLALSFAVLGTAAGASTHRTYALGRAKHCRVDFVKRTERHLVHGKHVRYVACVYHPKLVVTTTTSTIPTTPVSPPTAPVLAISYKAHLDPTFTQSSSSPESVTYSYSADATQSLGAVQTDLAAQGLLPSGILDLYSDGLLVCSINVGGSTVGGSCPVAYSTLGTHQVITEYIPNGVNAVTETDTENIAAFPSTTTVTNVAVGPETVDSSQNYARTVTVSVTVSGQGTSPTGIVTMSGGTCSAMSSGSTTCSAVVEESTTGATQLTPTISYSGDADYDSSGTSTTAQIPQASAPTVTNQSSEVQCAESGGYCTIYNSVAGTTGADANVYAGTMVDNQSPQVGTVTFTSSDHILICTATVYSAAGIPSNNARCTGSGGPFQGPISVSYSGGSIATGDSAVTRYASATTSGGSN